VDVKTLPADPTDPLAEIDVTVSPVPVIPLPSSMTTILLILIAIFVYTRHLDIFIIF
jgi:hypothetical protein